VNGLDLELLREGLGAVQLALFGSFHLSIRYLMLVFTLSGLAECFESLVLEKL
jgi:hypothetical protein